MTELAVLASDPSGLERFTDPAQGVIEACERAKQWLTYVLDHGDISAIVELKSQAEAIRVYTAQKQIGKDAELAAAEVVRRAERGIGVAIRRGQEAGTIRKLGDAAPLPKEPYQRVRNGRVEVVQPPVFDEYPRLESPRRYLPHPDDMTKTYAVTDGVSDDAYDTAIAEAKAEGNLSRANVIRKVKAEPPKPTGRPELLRKTRHHDSNRIVNETVLSLEGLVLGCNLIDFDALNREQVPAWVSSLSESLRSLNRIHRQLKELDRG